MLFLSRTLEVPNQDRRSLTGSFLRLKLFYEFVAAVVEKRCDQKYLKDTTSRLPQPLQERDLIVGGCMLAKILPIVVSHAIMLLQVPTPNASSLIF